jgi:hypothetical protein
MRFAYFHATSNAVAAIITGSSVINTDVMSVVIYIASPERSNEAVDCATATNTNKTTNKTTTKLIKRTM